MELLQATGAQVEAVLQMRLAYLQEEFPQMPEAQRTALAQSLTGYFEAHLGRDLLVFLALEEGQAVASVMLWLTERPANPNFPTGKVGTVMNVYTTPSHRRQGLAEQLLRQLIAEADRRRLDFLELKATAAGFPLYQKLGFRQTESSYSSMKLLLKSS